MSTAVSDTPQHIKARLDFYVWKRVNDGTGAWRYILHGIGSRSPGLIIVTSYVIRVSGQVALTASGSYYILGSRIDRFQFTKLVEWGQSPRENACVDKNGPLVEFGGKYRIRSGAKQTPKAKIQW